MQISKSSWVTVDYRETSHPFFTPVYILSTLHLCSKEKGWVGGKEIHVQTGLFAYPVDRASLLASSLNVHLFWRLQHPLERTTEHPLPNRSHYAIMRNGTSKHVAEDDQQSGREIPFSLQLGYLVTSRHKRSPFPACLLRSSPSSWVSSFSISSWARTIPVNACIFESAISRSIVLPSATPPSSSLSSLPVSSALSR